MRLATNHPVQLHILEQLRTAPDGLRYSFIKPRDIENDLYNYHLQYLAKNNLIIKRDEKYFLNENGKKHIIELNPINPNGESNLFKMAAAVMLVRESKNGLELLYQRRSRQPFAGQVEIIGGGIKRGEAATAAARRRLKEEAGLRADFKLFGLIRKTIFDLQDRLYSDILFHLCISESYTGELVQQNQYGEHLWVTIAKAAKIEMKNLNGSKQLSSILQGSNRENLNNYPLFYIEETYRHDIA